MQAILDENEFNTDDKLIAVKFWAEWCGPCKMIQPSILKLEKEFPDVKFVSVEIDQTPEIAERFKIKSLPSILLLKNGEEVNRINGVSLIDSMRKAFRDLISDK
jgi:thioredoxin 1